MENPIKMDDLEVPLFLETPIYMYFNEKVYGYIYAYTCVCVYVCVCINIHYMRRYVDS